MIAKRRDLPYMAGERSGMVKIKPVRTVDCVVGGFRYASRGKLELSFENLANGSRVDSRR